MKTGMECFAAVRNERCGVPFIDLKSISICRLGVNQLINERKEKHPDWHESHAVLRIVPVIITEK